MLNDLKIIATLDYIRRDSATSCGLLGFIVQEVHHDIGAEELSKYVGQRFVFSCIGSEESADHELEFNAILIGGVYDKLRLKVENPQASLAMPAMTPPRVEAQRHTDTTPLKLIHIVHNYRLLTECKGTYIYTHDNVQLADIVKILAEDYVKNLQGRCDSK